MAEKPLKSGQHKNDAENLAGGYYNVGDTKANARFNRISGVVPEPSTIVLALLGLSALSTPHVSPYHL